MLDKLKWAPWSASEAWQFHEERLSGEKYMSVFTRRPDWPEQDGKIHMFVTKKVFDDPDRDIYDSWEGYDVLICSCLIHEMRSKHGATE